MNLALPQKLCYELRSQVTSVTVRIFLLTGESIVGWGHDCGFLASGEQGMVRSGVQLVGVALSRDPIRDGLINLQTDLGIRPQLLSAASWPLRLLLQACPWLPECPACLPMCCIPAPVTTPQSVSIPLSHRSQLSRTSSATGAGRMQHPSPDTH